MQVIFSVSSEERASGDTLQESPERLTASTVHQAQAVCCISVAKLHVLYILKVQINILSLAVKRPSDK